jgi:hypothetical protein
MPQSDPKTSPRNWRPLLFGAVCLAAFAAVLGYARYSRRHAEPVRPTTIISTDPKLLSAIRSRPHLVFRSTALESSGRIAIVPLEDPTTARALAPLACERVYATSTDGLCLSASRGVFTRYEAQTFDADFKIVSRFPLAGAPSRARVSANGAMGVSTVFVAGDSYSTGSFSTRTTLYDLRKGQALGDLESFAVERDGQVFSKPDFNFWGVTFTRDGSRFYAVLGTGGELHLVSGDPVSRRMHIMREGVECPSLSPDEAHLVFKSRVHEGGRLIWRLHVLDLRSGKETVVQEPQSVDDQAEWLDADHVLYSLPRPSGGGSDVWVARADGKEPSRLFLAQAFSPSVVRP